MVKKIVVTLPPHVKKFFQVEYDGYQRKSGMDEIHVDKHSELGKLIHLISRPIPYTQKTVIAKGSGALTIRYYSHVQSMEVPVDKLPDLALFMEEIFRRTMVAEVRGGHELVGCDYGPLVTSSLKRRGIERDVDVDYQTCRKVYRDHISKINRRTSKLFEKSYA
ncbi:hypothetical protein [Dyadobacter diqingensis]|uniref:hypothetical protein n=1 Tax=Dyadobacter diqingensis TaxID=2938121 RepID=UPI0020C46C00|nr:hypothetical protein [Dyadobacter diqingensis]